MKIDSVDSISSMMEAHGAKRLFYKVLAENDNSKNQIYLGGDYSTVKVLPSGEFSQVKGSSNKTQGVGKDIVKAPLNFSWLTENGVCVAPYAQLILYPQYPEVRMSGFLRACLGAPSSLMAQRLAGRLLFIGVTDKKSLIGLVVAPHEALENEANFKAIGSVGLLRELPMTGKESSEVSLLNKIQEIFHASWIESFRLNSLGNKVPYLAQNGAGYTLEGMFGISPNGTPLPDYLDWELKAVKANANGVITPKSPITLMTPEPTAGLYVSDIEQFIKCHCKQTKTPNVTYFTGKRVVGEIKDGLILELKGIKNGKIIDPSTAGLYLVNTTSREHIALWYVTSILNHWKNKHQNTAYIPYNKSNTGLHYRFFGDAVLASGVDFSRILSGLEEGRIFYDPGIKATLSPSNGRTKVKKRNQFRVCFCDIAKLYVSSRFYNINKHMLI